MGVQTFYKTEACYIAVVGLLTAVVAPHTRARAAQHQLLEQINPLRRDNPVRMLPVTTLFMSQPPAPVGSARSPRAIDLLGKAFQNDDLNSLYGAGSFGTCETSSRIPSFFEKNYSNFAYLCFEEHKNRQAAVFDERFQSNPSSQGYATSPLGGRVQWKSISAGASERLLQRSINDLAYKNRILADILQGRISIDFGFATLWRPETRNKTPGAVRPRYVVELDSSPNEPSALNKKKYLASIGPLPEESFENTQSVHWLSRKPKRAKRTIRETFESSSIEQQSSEQQSNSHENSALLKEFSSAYTTVQVLSRMAGLEQIPFTKVNMRAERRIVSGKTQFALRATESQSLMFAEIPDVRSVSAMTLIWGYRVPWQRHALHINFNEATQERTTSYSYKIDDENKTDISYSNLSRAVSAGFVVSF